MTTSENQESIKTEEERIADPATAERQAEIEKYEKMNRRLLKIVKAFVCPAPMILLLIVMTVCQMPFLIMAFSKVMNDPSVMSGDVMQSAMELFTKEYAATSYIVYGIVGLIFFGLWYGLVYVRKEPKKINPLESISLSSVFMAAGAALGAFGAVELFMTLLAMFAPSMIESYAERIENSGIISFNGIFPILSMYVVAPVIEELAIRGLSMKLLKWAGFGAVGILIWQAVFFGIMHLDPVQSSYTFLVGLVLGYMAYHYKSIYLSILTHVFFNITGTVVPTLLSKISSDSGESSSLHLIIYIAAVVLFVIIFIADRLLSKYLAFFWPKTIMELIKNVKDLIRNGQAKETNKPETIGNGTISEDKES